MNDKTLTKKPTEIKGRIPAALKRRLEREARSQMVSVSHLMRQLLDSGLQALNAQASAGKKIA